MKMKLGSKGPFTERLYLPASRIERFIEKKFGLIPEYLSLPAGVLGYTVFGPSHPTRMVIDRGLAETDSIVAQRRINTTLAHEAGHCIFHTQLFTERTNRGYSSTLTINQQHRKFFVETSPLLNTTANGGNIKRMPRSVPCFYQETWCFPLQSHFLRRVACSGYPA